MHRMEDVRSLTKTEERLVGDEFGGQSLWSRRFRNDLFCAETMAVPKTCMLFSDH